jgi:hypothetical protein
MSAFNQASNVDTRHSRFNQAAGDWNQTCISTANYYYYINSSTSDSQQIAHVIQDNHSMELSRPTFSDGMVSQRGVATKPYHSFDALSVIGTAVGLIAQLTDGLIRRGDPSNNQLRSLNQTLTQLEFAIKVYNGRPLGQSLANTITPEVKQCVVVMLEWLEMVKDPWRLFRRKTLDEHEVALKRDLSYRQTSLDGLLIALDS